MQESREAKYDRNFLQQLESNASEAIFQRLSMLVWGVNFFIMTVLYVFFTFYATTYVLYALTFLLICHILFRIVYHRTQKIFLFKVLTFIVFYCFITICSFIGGDGLNIINFYFILVVEILFLFRRPNTTVIISFLIILFFSFFGYKFLEDNSTVLPSLVRALFPNTFLDHSRFHEGFIVLQFGSIAYILFKLGLIWHSRLHAVEKVNYQFQEIIEALPFEVAIIDEDKRYLFLNKLAIKDEQRRKWMVGKTDMEYALEYGKDVTAVGKRVGHMEEALHTIQAVKFTEEINSGTSKIHTIKYINPIISSFFSNQKILVCTSVDVSDLVEVTKKLNIANDTLESKNDELRSLTYMIGHDLRSPVRSTLLSLQILQKKYNSTLSEKDNHLIDTALSQMKFSIGFLEDLFKYSTVGVAKLDISDIDMNSLMVSIEQIIEPELKSKKASLIIETPLPSINANTTLITNLFMNLILNGLKYNESDHPLVRISCEVDSINCLWKVCDNGIGIPEENRETIFKLFTRVKTDKIYQGSGIGLSTCKKIVESYGGEIYVESELNKGTCFYVRLPISS
jgi:signal transduction histidine kinase